MGFCDADLSLPDVPFTPRCSSEKRTQAAADLEDILLAFSKLDEADKIPQIFCEATDLVKLPPDSVVQCRPWPMMLQPLSSWNRRLVLSAVRKLKGYTVSNIYISEDLSLVERQKRRE